MLNVTIEDVRHVHVQSRLCVVFVRFLPYVRGNTIKSPLRARYIGATHGYPGIDHRALVSTPVEDVGRGT